jgi:hypothetical protein
MPKYIGLARLCVSASLVSIAACSISTQDPATDAGTGAPVAGGGAPASGEVVGTFTVNLVAPTETDPSGHTTLVGKVYDGPTLQQIIWEKAAESGACRLSTPRVPFCETPCGGSAACIEDDMCKPHPTAHSVGTVRVSGIKTTAGATEFSMEPIAKTYQPSGDVKLPYPAFAEGDTIKVDAAGGDYAAFSISARGVAPLVLPKDPIALARDQPLALSWTKSSMTGLSSIHVKLDISHHGGTKGMIECDSDDAGSLTIAGELITKLLDLGVAGFPTIIVTRHSDGSTKIAPGTVTLAIASVVETAVEVPGLSSCTEDTDCQSGKSCQSDLTCK